MPTYSKTSNKHFLMFLTPPPPPPTCIHQQQQLYNFPFFHYSVCVSLSLFFMKIKKKLLKYMNHKVVFLLLFFFTKLRTETDEAQKKERDR